MQHPEHRGGPAHVELHLVHALPRLQGDPAGVEGHPLAHQHDGAGLPLGAAVLEHDEARGLPRAPGDREERPHAELLHVPLVQDFDVQGRVLPGQRARLLGQELGGTDVGGQIGEVPGALHAVGDGDPLAQSPLPCLQVPAPAERQREAAQRPRRPLLLALHPVEPVGGAAGRDDCLPNPPGEVPVTHAETGQQAHRVGRGGRGDGPGRARGGSGERAGREVPLASAADQQHALGGDPRDTLQQQRLPDLALQVAPAEHVGQVALGGAVQGLGGRREPAPLEHAHGEEAGLHALGCAGPEAEVDPLAHGLLAVGGGIRFC